MPWLNINPESEPYNRQELAAEIQGKYTRNLTPEDMADSYNLIEQMGCEIPPTDAPTWVEADYHDWEEDDA